MPFSQDHKRLARLAKRVLPAAGGQLSLQRIQSAIGFVETAAAMMQGKGAGSGWDILSEVKAALPFIGADATVLDVGAYKGEWSRAIQQARPDARIILFEPQQSCYPYLEHIGTLVRTAVGETNGSAVLYSPGHTAANASLYDRRDTYFADQRFRSAPIAQVTIDAVLAERGIDRVDYMKMDIEGHELFALRGAARALADGSIRALSFEFGSGNVNSRTFFRDYWDMLAEGYRYRVLRVLPGGRLLPVARYTEELEYFRGVSNYVAVHEQAFGAQGNLARAAA